VTPDELRSIVREEIIAAGVGADPPPFIYDLAAEQMVLGAVLEEQVTLAELAPFRPAHCAVQWIEYALGLSGPVGARVVAMADAGYPRSATNALCDVADATPTVAVARVLEAAARVTELYRQRRLAFVCRQVAGQLATGVDFAGGVDILREVIGQIKATCK
jgi:hypothetical protein